MSVGAYQLNLEAPANERAAWQLVEAAARKGLFDSVRACQVSNLDIRLARQFLESRGAKMQIPGDHRDMYLKLIGEAERYLRANPKCARLEGLGDCEGLSGIFDAIWGGIKAVGGAIGKAGKAVVNVGGKIFKAGQETQAGSTEIQKRAEEIAGNVAGTVKTARGVTDAIASELTAGKVDSVASGFFKSDTGKLVMIGGGLLVLMMVMKKGGK